MLVQRVKNKSFYSSKNLSSLHIWTAIIYNRDYKQWMKHIINLQSDGNLCERQTRRQKLHYLSTLIHTRTHTKLMIESKMFAQFDIVFNINLVTTVIVSYDCSPPTKMIITHYKNVPKYAKKYAAIKFSYKPHDTKTPQSPLKIFSEICRHKPQHN